MIPPRRDRAVALARAGLGALALAGLSGLAACGSDGGSSKSFCAALRSAPTLESVVSGFSRVDRSELERRLDRAASAYATVGRTAPGDIDDDVDTVVEVVDAVIEAVRANPDDPEAATSAVRAELVRHADLEGAAGRVAAYAKDECDLDLNPGNAPDPADTTVPTVPVEPDDGAATTVAGG